MIGTWAVRRREKRRIMDEAMIFDSASMIADPHNHNDSSKLESGIPSRRGRGVSRSISKRSYKRMSDESFGHVSQGPSGYGGVLPGGDYAGYGIPTLAYASPSTIIQPQYPQAMHVDRQRTYEDDNQPPYYHYGTAS
ncbi:hypothetical protein EYR36_006133 [Pleurotus pulmonarius]|nr:hypothetical protein EYR36_006133 [Pleurotus pulmonarius]KAF4600840.1 hypothetical protein EYR38_005485 [Pleurotus pulmonarius]